jgi:hypothetical protein
MVKWLLGRGLDSRSFDEIWNYNPDKDPLRIKYFERK